MNHQARMRWRCRRGMLELDIILQRFIDNHYEQLDEYQLELLATLLSFPDHDLWNMIICPPEESDNQFRPVLKFLREN